MAEPSAIIHGTLADCAVAAWREGRFGTLTIAKRLGVSEPEVCKAIAADQDKRERQAELAELRRRLP